MDSGAHRERIEGTSEGGVTHVYIQCQFIAFSTLVTKSRLMMQYACAIVQQFLHFAGSLGNASVIVLTMRARSSSGLPNQDRSVCSDSTLVEIFTPRLTLPAG